jgi:hypothetical protein
MYLAASRGRDKVFALTAHDRDAEREEEQDEERMLATRSRLPVGWLEQHRRWLQRGAGGVREAKERRRSVCLGGAPEQSIEDEGGHEQLLIEGTTHLWIDDGGEILKSNPLFERLS